MSYQYRPRKYRPGHPRATTNGQLYDYILVVEQHTGLTLKPSQPIHHVNGDPTDNRPSNLVVCDSPSYHCLIELRTRALAASGNANYRRCGFCKEWDNPAEMFIGRYKYGRNHVSQVYHRVCRNAWLRGRGNQ